MTKTAAIIGGGPAGLMAASVLAKAGVQVSIYESKPSLGRKFLMAGKSGLNLSKDENLHDLLAAYGDDKAHLEPMIADFTPQHVKEWAQALGQETFTGSSGRIFPKIMKASPLLRAWVSQLDMLGAQRHTRWRFMGWKGNNLCFETPQGIEMRQHDVCVLAMGGASWSRLGSDGLWANILHEQGIELAPFQGVNVGIAVKWSDKMAPHFGQAIKSVAWHVADTISRGEAVISQKGLEGGGVYSLSEALIKTPQLRLDLMPDHSHQSLTQRLSKPKGKMSLSNFLRKTLRLPAVKIALMQEWARPLPTTPDALAACMKSLPVAMSGLRPMDEAISTSGGVTWGALTPDLMLRAHKGVFCAGEMIDWSAPTGGYLLTGCFASGQWAGRGALKYLAQGKG